MAPTAGRSGGLLQPGFSASPDPVPFGAQTVGNTSSWQTVINTGTSYTKKWTVRK